MMPAKDTLVNPGAGGRVDEAGLLAATWRSEQAAEHRYKLGISLSRVLLALAVLLLWQTGSGQWIDPFFFSSPLAILKSLWELAVEGLLAFHAGYTLLEALAGYVSGALVALLLAFLVVIWRSLYDVFEPFMMAFYSVPRVALAPLFIMWFGIGITPKVLIAAMLTFFIVFINTVAGFRSVNREFINISRLMGASTPQIIRSVIVPAALPYIITALRVTVPQAVLGAIVGEFISASRGLGYLVASATGVMDTTRAFAGLVVLVVFVMALNAGLNVAERHLLRWQPPQARAGKA